MRIAASPRAISLAAQQMTLMSAATMKPMPATRRSRLPLLVQHAQAVLQIQAAFGCEISPPLPLRLRASGASVFARRVSLHPPL